MRSTPSDVRRTPSGVRRILILFVLALVPWTAFPTGDFVFAWGLVTTAPTHVTTLPDYLFVQTSGLPRRLLAWPVSTILYLLALGSATVGVAVGHEDGRVTGGLLALAGASQLSLVRVGHSKPVWTAGSSARHRPSVDRRVVVLLVGLARCTVALKMRHEVAGVERRRAVEGGFREP